MPDSKFSREHYEMIAAALNQEMKSGKASSEEWIEGFTAATMALAGMFEEDNVRFSYKFFFDLVNKVER